MSELTKEQITKIRRLYQHNDDLRALLDAYEERGREVEEWKSRFKAIVDEDRPDMAGNAVLHLKAEIERLRASNERLLEIAKTAEDEAEEDTKAAWARAEQAEARLREMAAVALKDLDEMASMMQSLLAAAQPEEKP